MLPEDTAIPIGGSPTWKALTEDTDSASEEQTKNTAENLILNVVTCRNLMSRLGQDYTKEAPS
jgi:hypothetical protein